MWKGIAIEASPKLFIYFISLKSYNHIKLTEEKSILVLFYFEVYITLFSLRKN